MCIYRFLFRQLSTDLIFEGVFILSQLDLLFIQTAAFSGICSAALPTVHTPECKLLEPVPNT